MVDHGYALIVVSNHEVDSVELERLKPITNFIIVRHNFGYDFAGYREGILLAFDQFSSIERLVILNDSVWFPCNTLHNLWVQLENIDVDFSGVHIIEKHKGKRFWSDDYQFLPSYLISFNQKAVNSEAFIYFWLTYNLSSDKYKTMRHGERGISRKLVKSGLTMGAILKSQEVAKRLAEAPIQTRLAVLNYIKLNFSENYPKIKNLLMKYQGKTNDKTLYLELISLHQFLALFPIFCIQSMGVNIIKKNNQYHFKLARAEIVKALDSGNLMLDPFTENELRSQVQSESQRGSFLHK